MPFPVAPILAPFMVEYHISGVGFDDKYRLFINSVIEPDPSGLYAWTIPAAGGSLNLSTSLNGLATAMAHAFIGSDSIGQWELWKLNGSLPRTFIGPVTGASVAGTASGSTVFAVQQTINFNTSGGRQARIVMLNTNGFSDDKQILPPNTGVFGVVAAAIVAEPNFVGRDGTPMSTPRSVTQTINRRLRRKYGLT